MQLVVCDDILLKDSSSMSAADDGCGHMGPVCSVDSHDKLSILLSTG